MSFSDPPYLWAQAALLAAAARLERVCELAVLSGKHGVMVNGANCWVDQRVPYGYIWDVTACGPDHPNLAIISTMQS